MCHLSIERKEIGRIRIAVCIVTTLKSLIEPRIVDYNMINQSINLISSIQCDANVIQIL